MAMCELPWCIVSDLLNTFPQGFELVEESIQHIQYEDAHGDSRVISRCLMVGTLIT